MKILILFAHPALHKSRVNRWMIEGLDNLDNVTFHDLYEEYPELDIDIEKEQKLLEEHDVIIFQFPLFWYSTPAILKEWQDLVLEHGWAFGSKGNALKGKFFMCSVTVGGPRKAYQLEDFHNHTLNQLLSPLKQTASLCKMLPLPPFVVHGSHGINRQQVMELKKDFLSLIKSMSSDVFDYSQLANVEYMNDFLEKAS